MSVRSIRRISAGVSCIAMLGACVSAPRVSQPPSTGGAPAAVAPEAAVAGDIPDTQAFVAYSPTAGGYTINVPEGWARSADGAATVFTDKYNTIRLESIALPAAPTVGSVKQTDLASLAVLAKGYQPGKVSSVTRKSGTAIVATFTQDSSPNAVTAKVIRLDVERYVFWKAGEAVVVMLSSASGSDNVDPWKAVTEGFGWV